MPRFLFPLAAALIAAGTLDAQQADDDFRWSGALAAGRTLEVRGVSGNLTVSAASGGTAVVRARKSARRGDLAAVQVKVEESAAGAVICVVYVKRGGDCDAGSRSKGDWNGDEDVSVDFTVEVPAGVRFEGSTVNGGIEARGLRSDAELSTVNGDVELETTGTGSARTVNGGVRLRMGRASWDGTLDASTVNGGVQVTMPTPTNLEVDAATTNGSISSDFPLTLQGKMSSQKLRGTIGKGGPRLKLATVNGDVELRKAS
jgi:hypothetical protein